MHSFYAVTRDGAWLRAACYHPGEMIVHRSGRRDEVARAILNHATGDEGLAVELTPGLVDVFLSPVPDGGVPVVVHTADLLLWVVRQLREEQR